MSQYLIPFAHRRVLHSSRSWTQRLHIDFPLFFSLCAISALGLFILYSAKQDVHVVYRQLLRLGLATMLMLAVAQCSPTRLFKLGPWLYGGSLALLIFVLVLGKISKGGQRWLDFWAFRFQPAELMKLAVPLLIARYFATRALYPPSLTALCLPGLLIGIPAVLIAKQPDLGTALLVASSGMWGIFFSGVRWRLIVGLACTLSFSLPLLWYGMRDYQKQRILTLFDPNQDPLGTGYQIIQSKIAIGSGGVYGKGWLNGTQAQLEYLPERTTDFIFSVFSEEFGLIGGVFLLGLYVLIIARGLYISTQAQDFFSKWLAASLTMSLFVYVFVNIGMVSGILPVVGVPLPFISYGGTSLVTLMCSFGILMSIQTHPPLKSFHS